MGKRKEHCYQTTLIIVVFCNVPQVHVGKIPYPKAFGLNQARKSLADFVDSMPLSLMVNHSAAPPEYVFGDRNLELLSRDVGRVRAYYRKHYHIRCYWSNAG